MRGILDTFGDLFWGGVAALVGLAVIVTVLRFARNRVPMAAGIVNKTASVTGVGI
jgi:hypothetical protein